MGKVINWHKSISLSVIVVSGLTAGTVFAQSPTGATPSAPPAASKPSTEAKPESSDSVVMKVGDEKFTKADLDFLVANTNPQAQQRASTPQGKQQIGEQFATLIVLSEQAHNHGLDQTADFQRRLTMQKMQLQAQVAYQEIVQQAKVTPEEVSQYYSTHANEFEQVMLRQFVVRKRAANAAGGPGLPPDQAKTRIDAIHAAVVAGTDAKKVSEDFKAPDSVIIEPEPRPVRHGGMRPEIEKAVFALKDGDVSEIFDLGSALAFFQLTAHSHAELKDASPQIEQELQKQRVAAAVEDLKKKSQIWMDDRYFAAPNSPATTEPGGNPGTTKPIAP